MKKISESQTKKERSDGSYNWFIKADVSKYSGKWVAVDNKKIVASSVHIAKLLEEVNKNWPSASITKVPKRGQIMIL